MTPRQNTRLKTALYGLLVAERDAAYAGAQPPHQAQQLRDLLANRRAQVLAMIDEFTDKETE